MSIVFNSTVTDYLLCTKKSRSANIARFIGRCLLLAESLVLLLSTFMMYCHFVHSLPVFFVIKSL